MKKFFVFLLGILLLGGLFVSCSGDDEEDKEQLGYYIANGKVYLAVPHRDKTIYVKIYRTDAKETVYYHIGEIIPSAINCAISYTFEDELVVNTTYKYLAVYYMWGDYFITDWTDEVNVLGSSFSSLPVAHVSSDAYFTYDADTSRLTLTEGEIGFSDVTDSDSFFKDYSVNLCLKCGGETSLLKLTKDNHTNFTKDEYLSMDAVLPASFIGNKVTMVGPVLQKETKFPENATAETLQYKTIHWSNPAIVKVMLDSKNVTEFTVTKHSSDSGYDYDSPIDNPETAAEGSSSTGSSGSSS